MTLVLFAILLIFVSSAVAQDCKTSDDEFLVTFHPHLDAFWLNTNTQLKDINFKPEQFLYKMNQRNSKIILNSMLQALNESKQRKYFLTETLFFKDWYNYMSDSNKIKVKSLLKTGQLEIANAGWVQNDEAVCYYDDILNQYTVGMNFLYQQFGYHTKIGWATDSFGHSHSQAALLHLLGIEFQGIQRVDDRYIALHRERPLLQFFWQPISDSNNMSYGGVLNHVRHFLHEVNDFRTTPLELIKEDFEKIIKIMKKYYNHNKLFRFLGNDFQEFTIQQFQNLQKVMTEYNKNYQTQACSTFKYGNPSDYLNKITTFYEKQTLHVRQYDFIPNWDQERYWTGYFTTNPLVKKTCKDFSRLINLYKKSLFLTNSYLANTETISVAEQLLALMQHHDGITATSKKFVLQQLMDQIKNASLNIINSVSKIYNMTNALICKFYEQNNECQIPNSYTNLKTLHILTHGASKVQKIQLILPNNTFYDISQADQDIFCEKDNKCTLVFQVVLHPGVNIYTLNKKNREEIANQIFIIQPINGLSSKFKDFTLSIDNQDNNIKYSFGDGQYFNIGIYTLMNKNYIRKKTAWNKYGYSETKNDRIASGLYIMANNGKLPNTGTPLTNLMIAQGNIFARFYVQSINSKIKVTIKKDMPNIIDVVHSFCPSNTSIIDYFMKVSSSVKSETLYHDSNGFLVSKRQFNKRPDYEFNVINSDNINANTYPACSFAYLMQNNKKFLFFSDRAQGVASYEKDLLINFDRLTQDDGKGVSETYIKSVNNTFRYKFAIVSAQDDIERLWQRNYDQPLLAYLSDNQQRPSKSTVESKEGTFQVESNQLKTYLKYSIFYLNNDQFVLRLQNMGEFSNLTLTKYNSLSWDMQELGLKFIFVDIKESYANGIPLYNYSKQRKYWGKNIQNTITVSNPNKLNSNTIHLRPLQIRSFRVNTKQKIAIRQVPVTEPEPQVRRLRKRCF